jgi:urease accessory protein
VDVQRSGSIVLMDWMTAGRRASGERWVFDRYASRLTIRYDGRVVFHDALLLSPSEGPLAERMGRFDCVCLIVLVGVALRVHAASACKDMAGMSVEDVGRAARTWLHFVPGLLGDDPWARKW